MSTHGSLDSALAATVFNPDYEILQRGYSSVAHGPISLESFVYAEIKPVFTPREVASESLSNALGTDATQSITVSKSVTLTQSWQFTKGVQTDLSFPISAPGVGKAVGTATVKSSESTVTANTASTTLSFSVVSNVTIKAGKKMTAHVLLEEANIQVPFTGSILVRCAGVRYVGGQPPLIDPVGVIFMRSPHPAVTVIDNGTIRCAIEGIYEGVHGDKFTLSLSEEDIDKSFPSKAVASVQFTQ